MSDHRFNLISPLVEASLQELDLKQLRHHLVSKGIMNLESSMTLDIQTAKYVWKAYLMADFAHWSSEQLIAELNRLDISWDLDIEADFQQGAISY